MQTTQGGAEQLRAEKLEKQMERGIGVVFVLLLPLTWNKAWNRPSLHQGAVLPASNQVTPLQIPGTLDAAVSTQSKWSRHRLTGK
jgi:hypothetical protein